MNYLVAKLIVANNAAARAMLRESGNSPEGLGRPRDDYVKNYFTSLDVATTAAENLAKKYPGEQFAIFTVAAIRESKATLIKKTINESGEVVVDKDAN